MDRLTVEDPVAYTDPERAGGYLANRLQDGCLGLFLGAGVSMDVGLMSWGGLTESCLAVANIDRSDFSSELKTGDYYAVIAEFERRQSSPETYFANVRQALYSSGFKYDTEFIRSRLLISLGVCPANA